MSAQAYERGSKALQKQIDADLAAYYRQMKSGTGESFISRMREELNDKQIEINQLGEDAAALRREIDSLRSRLADQDNAIANEKRRADHKGEMLVEHFRAYNNLQQKHIKLSSLFRLVCTPERYQQLSREYDEQHQEVTA